MGSLLALVLTASPFFFVENDGLRRTTLEPGAQNHPVKLPGWVRSHAPREGLDVVVVCPSSLPRSEFLQACEVLQVDGRGAVTALKLKAVRAELLPGGRELLFLTEQLELKRRVISSGEEKLLARHVLQAHLSEDGTAAGVSTGLEACPAKLLLETGSLTPLEGPCGTLGPHLSNDGHFVYVTTATGQASLVIDGKLRVGKDVTEKQRPGLEVLGPTFVPLPQGQVFFQNGRAYWMGEGGRSELVELELSSGNVRRLGEGGALQRVNGALWFREPKGRLRAVK